MKKVLLLNPPGTLLYLRDQHCSSRSKANYYWPPVDLIIQSGILHEQHEIAVLDAIVEGLSIEESMQRIHSFNPEYIVFLTGIHSWKEDFSFLEKVKQDTGAVLIGSGDVLLWDHEKVLKEFPFIDAILMNFTTHYILNYISGDYTNLKDICYREGNTVVLTPLDTTKEFTIPVPRHELFRLEKYSIPHGKTKLFSSMLTNYGCPYKCNYCIAENTSFKYRPVENILAEIEHLISLGIREIFFKDFTFGLPKENIRHLCEEMVKRFPGLNWICSSRVNVLDEEMLHLMKKAGCHTIQFGVESSSQAILDDNHKEVRVDNIEKMFKLCKKLGIRTLAHFILGLPGETENTIKETVQFAKKIKCSYASFNVAVPLPGTTLRKKCIENGWLKEESDVLYGSWALPVIETPNLTREKLWKLRNEAVSSFYLRPSYILSKLLEINSIYDMKRLFNEGFSLIKTIRPFR